MSDQTRTLPRWIDIGLIPLINVAMALVVSGVIILAIGENPIDAVVIMLHGALGYEEGVGYTLYYATNFIFTGLAVAMAFHAGLFNIGGEGQAYIGGLGVGLAMLGLDHVLPMGLLIPIAILMAAAGGALWALIPAYLQAYRGSHVVITTIMFNFIASALMVYLMVHVLIEPGQQSPESREFAANAQLPFIYQVLGWFGIPMAKSPANLSLVWALICCVGVWFYIWRTKWGYELRAVGFNERAAIYGGVRPARVIILTMCLSGALAGFVGLNEIMGVQHKLLLDFTAGYGFTGIAVSLMGRNHPLGIILASLLFGVLYQGGADLAFDVPNITREMVVAIQGLIILFSGALAYMSTPWITRLYFRLHDGATPSDPPKPAHEEA
ncbi:ABC transporter permease [Varunaivibrio sulfuroxidans]|uniref:Nucleoside ABC transporter membrane protein n=1 Tax=Varunaivibrio sulfuroxidans TaxID=1773489 RepID=A0A4R3JD75_9PROT|nr:ABC transporter permease [Varunaivibrio sulfuroxidans]TCS63979.1 nucleoside ABC transporter membrane protein [Varunaivibrio sulfuroxidans]WES31568.1 ABC transporter permease [Varunaivibrio sulfuroxidans]